MSHRHVGLEPSRQAGKSFGETPFVTGALGEFAIHRLLGDVNPLLDTCSSLEAGGLVIGPLVPFRFGLFLPLIE